MTLRDAEIADKILDGSLNCGLYQDEKLAEFTGSEVNTVQRLIMMIKSEWSGRFLSYPSKQEGDHQSLQVRSEYAPEMKQFLSDGGFSSRVSISLTEQAIHNYDTDLYRKYLQESTESAKNARIDAERAKNSEKTARLAAWVASAAAILAIIWDLVKTLILHSK